jgi:DNA-binding CsgD family transcriptional regulator
MHRERPLASQGPLYRKFAEAFDRRQLAESLYDVARAFGYHSASFMQMPARNHDRLAENVIETNLPREFFEEHDRLTSISRCNVYSECRNSILPSVWRLNKELSQNVIAEVLPNATLKHYASFHITSSLLVPLRSLDAQQYLLRFDGERAEPEQSEINELMMFASVFFQAYDRLRYPNPQNPGALTDREIEIIEWTANGKTSTEIAGILSLSDHTVNAHISHAFKKLDCVTRAQLVAKAIRMRLIT